jgi:hypothetical protein
MAQQYNEMIQRWYDMNIELLLRIYSQVEYDNERYTWVLIYDVDLPPIYFQTYTNLLITTPGLNIEHHNNYNFYVDKDLYRTDGSCLKFLHNTAEYNPYSHMGYARLSYHLTSFRPSFHNIMSGDNLLQLVKATYHFIGKDVSD